MAQQWRKEDGDAARYRQEKREATRPGKLLSKTDAYQDFAKRHPLAWSTSRRNPCTDARRTETCVAPRHVDASRDIYFIFSERAAWGGGGCAAARLSFLVSFPCSADYERDWPPCKVLFRVDNQFA